MPALLREASSPCPLLRGMIMWRDTKDELTEIDSPFPSIGG